MTDSHKIYVTTGLKAKDHYVETAEEYAAAINAPYVERKERSMTKMRETYGDVLLVITDQAKLFVGEQEFFFHPSMAYTRIRRLKNGENDIVIARSGAQPGDVILDCTLGLGSDAIVFAHAVGETGQVIGIEASPVIATLVRRGMQELTVDVKEVNQAMRRVQVIEGDHLEYMKKLPDRSVDIVYFDPMFRRTVEDSASIEPLRILGDDNPLRLEAVEEAKRIARRRVVMRERWYSREFARLGFTLPRKSTGTTNYGIIEIGGCQEE